MKTKIVLRVFVTIAFVTTLLGMANAPWVPFGHEGQALADEVTVQEGIKRIEAFDKALKSGDPQKIEESARLLRANHYAVELIKNRPHLKLQLDKIPIKAPKVSVQGKLAQSPPLDQMVSSNALTQHLQPKPGADALEALPPDAPKGINEVSYQEMFGDGDVHTGSQATKKSSVLTSSGKVKASTGSQTSESSRGSSTSADPKLSKKPIAHQSLKKIQPELVSPKQSTASESAVSFGKVQVKSQALPTGSSGRPGTNADPKMANKSIEYKNVNRIQSESIGSESVAIPKHVADAKPKDIPMSTKTWHDLYQNIDERVKRHYSERKTMTEAETAKLYEQMNKRNIPRETYAPYAKGKKPNVDPNSNWSDINRAANYNAQTDLKKSAKFSKNPKLSTLVDPDNAYIHPDSVRSKNLQDLRINQSEALNNLKNEFGARTKGMNPGSTQYKEQLKVYSQKKKAIETTFKSHDKRGEHFTKLQKKYPNIKATGSPPKNVRADVDIATESLDEALKIKQEWQADGDDVLTYRDKKGRPYKIVNRTKDATMWPPETPEGRLAKINDLDAFTTTGGQKATGNINQPSSHKGFNLDNQKKLTHALDTKDWKTAAKSIDKAGRDVGLHKKNPEFYEKLGKLRNYGDGAQAGIYNTNDPPHVQQQKMQDFFKNQGTNEMARASKRAHELDVFKKKARTDLARQMRQAGRHDIADRITDRMNQVDISNQQAEEFLKTGKTKTGNKVLTKGKSTVVKKDGIVSKIKGSIAETRELNRLAKSAQNLPDFDKNRVIQEARAKHGDEFAKKLTKKMTPRKAGEFAKKVIGRTVDATMAAGMLADGIQQQREKLAKQDKEFGNIYSLDGVYEGTKNVGRSLENIGKNVIKHSTEAPYEMGKRTALDEIKKLPEYEKQVREDLKANGLLEGMSKAEQDALVRNIALTRAQTVASGKAVGKQIKGMLWDPFHSTSKSNLQTEALREYKAAKAAGEKESGLLDDNLSTSRSINYRYRAATKTSGDLLLMNRVFDAVHYDSNADRQAAKMEKKVTNYTKENLIEGLATTTRLREDIEKLTGNSIPTDTDSQARLQKLRQQYNEALLKVQRVDKAMKDKVDAKDPYVLALQKAVREIQQDPIPYGSMLKKTYNELENLSRTGDHTDAATRAQMQELITRYGNVFGQLKKQQGDVGDALSPNQMVEYANLMSQQQHEQLKTDTSLNSKGDMSDSPEAAPKNSVEDENPFLNDNTSAKRMALLGKMADTRIEDRQRQVSADQDAYIARGDGQVITDDELQGNLEGTLETMKSRDGQSSEGTEAQSTNPTSSQLRTDNSTQASKKESNQVNEKDSDQCIADTDCIDGYLCIDGDCLKQSKPLKCSKDNDCPKGYSCKNRNCVPAGCGKNADCPQGYVCRDGQCVASRSNELSDSCGKNADCPEGYACRSGQCVQLRPDKDKVPNSCGKNSDCPETYACRSGQCVQLRPDKDKVPNSCGKNSDCPEDYACRSGQCVKLRPDKVPSSCGKNADCPKDYACRSGQCIKLRPETKKPDGCSRDSDCPKGKVCIGGKCVEKPCKPKYGCCDEEPISCMGYCWPRGTDCCGDAICRPGTYCCQNNCCDKGEICCEDGGCCPAGTYCCIKDGQNQCCRY